MSSSEQHNHSSAIEINGVRFETIMPERRVSIPQRENETCIQLGVRITNHTLLPYRFNLPLFLPEALEPDGARKQMSLSSNAYRRVKKTDIPILLPNESLAFLMIASFHWYNDCLCLSGLSDYNAIWSFYNFPPGIYQIRLKYPGTYHKLSVLMEKGGRTEVEGFWTGTVSTPFVEFQLVET